MPPGSPERRIRATGSAPPQRGHLPVSSTDASADIEVTSRWLERDGQPWFPVTGEVHYSRIPRSSWDRVLGHAKAGGLNTVATYVFWRHHEPEPRRFNWDGNRDLRAFVRLAARHGLDVVVRIGPWAHGEARYGGLPDWLDAWAVEEGVALRTNDPRYLDQVRRFYAEIIGQLTGLTGDTGPVIACQIENELFDQPSHLHRLRTIAEELGLSVPLWTATGWGGAEVPDSLLPVYSAYADGFWADTDTEWPDFCAPHFAYQGIRDDAAVGADVREALSTGPSVGLTDPSAPSPEASAHGASSTPQSHAPTPFVTCELGGGMHVAYHRRPLVSPEDVAALALAKIGSGSVWQGYYMYAGGTHPHTSAAGPAGADNHPGQDGPGDQESQATGYPNDLPQLSYDFFAPIGEHGQIRPHHHRLRRQHLWLQAEGVRLAQMTSTPGALQPDEDRVVPEGLRWAVRSDGESGYLFMNTYQPRQAALPGQPGVQVQITFDDGDVVTVPAQPVDVPASASFVWPVRYRLTAGLVLRSATAQLVTRHRDRRSSPGDARDVVVLSTVEGIAAELVLDDGAQVWALHPDVSAGFGCVIELPDIRIVLLDEAAADQLYRLDLDGESRLLVSQDPVYISEGELVRQRETHLETLLRDVALHGEAPVPQRGGPADRLSAPTDFSGAGELDLQIPAERFDHADRLLLRLSWTGDVGRAYVGDELISDHFWHGREWDIDLTPWRTQIAEHGLQLRLLPWVRATGVWVAPEVRDVPDGITIDSVDLIGVSLTQNHPPLDLERVLGQPVNTRPAAKETS